MAVHAAGLGAKEVHAEQFDVVQRIRAAGDGVVKPRGFRTQGGDIGRQRTRQAVCVHG
ncbi:hypothetical protein D3C71_1399640 [compost metagenome]